MRITLISNIILLLLSNCTHTPASLKVMTFNIRYDNPDDGMNSWQNRKQHVVRRVRLQDLIQRPIRNFPPDSNSHNQSK